MFFIGLISLSFLFQFLNRTFVFSKYITQQPIHHCPGELALDLTFVSVNQ